ncbi:hypothetical protein EBR77_03760, partial [bacterium]|nr:hypothetical protein [bacterium]
AAGSSPDYAENPLIAQQNEAALKIQQTWKGKKIAELIKSDYADVFDHMSLDQLQTRKADLERALQYAQAALVQDPSAQPIVDKLLAQQTDLNKILGNVDSAKEAQAQGILTQYADRSVFNDMKPDQLGKIEKYLQTFRDKITPNTSRDMSRLRIFIRDLIDPSATATPAQQVVPQEAPPSSTFGTK